MSNEYTRKWWKERLHLIQAFAEGKCVQNVSMNGKEWITMATLHFQASVDSYRIAPELKLRPWKPDEVPVGKLRHKSDPSAFYFQCFADKRGITLAYAHMQGGTCEMSHVLYSDIAEWYEHSTDGGRTWAPCGVMEEQP